MSEEPALYETEQWDFLTETITLFSIEEKMTDPAWRLEDDSRLATLSPAEEFQIAESGEASPRNLDYLAEHTTDEGVLTAIANNLNTHADTLRLIASVCFSEDTYKAIILNPAADPETLAALYLNDSVPSYLKEQMVEAYRFDELVDDLKYRYDLKPKSFPKVWQIALKERTR